MKSYRYSTKLIGSIFLLLTGLAWIWSTRTPGYAQQLSRLAAPQEGFFAPDFTLNSLSNEEVTLSDLHGKPLIINFWASWCPPCRAEMPALQKTYNEFQSKDLVILGINATNQDRLSDVIKFVGDNNLTFPILLDQTGSISGLYNLNSLPTTFFIDQSGIIQKIIVGGPLPTALLRVEIGNLLEE